MAEMVERLEMVVSGQRRIAMPSVPEFSTRVSPSSGFIVEGHQLATFELPDHWIPFYMVGVQFVPRKLTRFFPITDTFTRIASVTGRASSWDPESSGDFGSKGPEM
jgi:hypothetical protein